MPQATEPYKFTQAGTRISGIAEAEGTTSVTIGGNASTAHNLASHPQVAGDWDNVYMPQPMTREKRGVAAGSTGPNSSSPSSSTLNDLYRYWPAHRDKLNGNVLNTVYETEIGNIGCDRYANQQNPAASISGSSDEGYWDGSAAGTVGVGTNYPYQSTHIGLNSPAYKTIYHTTSGSNKLISAPSNWTSANYLNTFLSTFAGGYFNNCCLLANVSTRNSTTNDNKDGPDVWGLFTEDANISYGVDYHDADWYINDWCNGVNNCGGLFAKPDIDDGNFEFAGGDYYAGGLGATSSVLTSDTYAGMQWLAGGTGNYVWKESDIRRLTEYSRNEFGTHNPAGKFGIIDGSRSNRQANDLRCMEVGEAQIHATGHNGNVDANEKCTYLCNSLGTSFVHEGLTFASSKLSPTS